MLIQQSAQMLLQQLRPGLRAIALQYRKHRQLDYSTPCYELREQYLEMGLNVRRISPRRRLHHLGQWRRVTRHRYRLRLRSRKGALTGAT